MSLLKMSPPRSYDSPRTMDQVRTLNRPRATGEGLKLTVAAKEDAPPEGIAYAAEAQRRIDEYLSRFVAPEEDGGCIVCGAVQGGFFGEARWGLAHGEARCARCGYPCRALHYIKLDDGADGEKPGEITLPYILQYHPDEIASPSGSPAQDEKEG